MWPMTSFAWTFRSSWIGGHTREVSPRSVQPFQRRFLKVLVCFFLNNMTVESGDCWRHLMFILQTILSRGDPQKFSNWSDVAFYTCNYDVIKITLIPHEYLPWAKFQFFPLYGFRGTEVQSFSVFPIWLPHHVTYDVDVIIIILTFFTSNHTYGENFVSIRQVVAEKNTKLLCGQTKNWKITRRVTRGETEEVVKICQGVSERKERVRG